MNISKRTTIKEVASAAGVSTQTVSRVINMELDFQPSALARSLISRRSYTLGIVTAGLKYIGPSRTLSGITSKAEELKYALLLEELPRFEAQFVRQGAHGFFGSLDSDLRQGFQQLVSAAGCLSRLGGGHIFAD